MTGELSFTAARQVARTAATPMPVVPARISEAVGTLLARPIVALSDLPAHDAAAMDGYAICGPGPWTLVGQIRHGELPPPLGQGQAMAILTGSAVPDNADCILRSEQARMDESGRICTVDALTGLPDGTRPPAGTDMRMRGEECTAGETLIEPWCIVSPQIAGLAAAAGHDVLEVMRPAIVAVLVTGDEVIEQGVPGPGRTRDALGPMLPAWVAALGARGNPPIRVPDTRDALIAEIDDASADVIITTGASGRGSADHLHRVLTDLGAHWLVDGVGVRPGHPMVLARLLDGRFVLGLPGNPLAAVAGMVTLGVPLLRAMGGLEPDDTMRGTLGADVRPHPADTRLVPVVLDGEVAEPMHFTGPAMLRSVALADGLAVIPPSGGARGSEVEVLALP